jgi:hypothetical protein
MFGLVDHTGYQVLNPSAFANPAPNTFGNLGACNVFLPRWINLNASLVKSSYIRERFKFDIKFDKYNVANHLSISSVNTGSFNGTKLVNGLNVSNTANWGALKAEQLLRERRRYPYDSVSRSPR